MGQTSVGGFGDAFILKVSPQDEVLWISQFGTTADEAAEGVALDETGAYVAGSTNGAFEGFANLGSSDAYVRKYGVDGLLIWTQQFGSSDIDQAYAISVHGSRVYVAGQTVSGFNPSYAFVRAFDVDGGALWFSPFAPGYVVPLGIAADESGEYVVGYQITGPGVVEGFIAKLDPTGALLWTDSLPAADQTSASDVAVHASGVFVVGRTNGALPGSTNLGNYDAFLAEYSATGEQLWIRQFGSAEFDEARGLAADETGIYVGGTTCRLNPPAAEGLARNPTCDVFVSEFTVQGGDVSTVQFGTGQDDLARDLSLDWTGVYVTGLTNGVFPGEGSSRGGDWDAFVAKVDR